MKMLNLAKADLIIKITQQLLLEGTVNTQIQDFGTVPFRNWLLSKVCRTQRTQKSELDAQDLLEIESRIQSKFERIREVLEDNQDYECVNKLKFDEKNKKEC